MSDMQKAAAAPGAETTTEEVSLLDQIVQEGRMARDPASKERGKNLVKEFVTQVLEGAMTVSKDAEAMINARIAQIDHLVSIQLSEVLHHPDFQKLEGKYGAVSGASDGSKRDQRQALKIKILNTSKKALLRDLQRASEFDQSALFKKGYEEEYGTFGGARLRGAGRRLRRNSDADRRISSSWRRCAQVASPRRMRLFLSAAGPDMLNMEKLHVAGRSALDMAKIFDSSEFAKWKSFRAEAEDSRYVGLDSPARTDALSSLCGKERDPSRMASTTKKASTAPITASICGVMQPSLLVRG